MTDPTQFVVDLANVHRVLTHEGLLGTGRDFLTRQPCSISIYSDKFKRNYIMQLFEAVDSDFVSNKITSMSKTVHSNFISNLLRMVFMSTRKTSKGYY